VGCRWSRQNKTSMAALFSEYTSMYFMNYKLLLYWIYAQNKIGWAKCIRCIIKIGYLVSFFNFYLDNWGIWILFLLIFFALIDFIIIFRYHIFLYFIYYRDWYSSLIVMIGNVSVKRAKNWWECWQKMNSEMRYSSYLLTSK